MMNLEENMNMDNRDEFTILNTVNKNENSYLVPNGYFDTLYATILFKIKLNSIREYGTLSVTKEYFSNLPERILAKINETESLPDTPVLNSISKENIYSVPENYFSKFSEKLSVDNKSETKIIPLRRKRRTWQMAVAAAVIFAIVLSAGFIWENNNQPAKAKTQYAGLIQKDLSSLSSTDISNYLNSPDGSISDESAEVDNTVSTQTSQQLQNVSAREMENYLNQTPATY